MSNQPDKRIFQARDDDRFTAYLKQLTRPLVFTNGCFDILHRGHVACLQTAAAMGATLLVGVNSDESVKRLGKDANRPFNNIADRLAVLAALQSVSAVVAFNEDTPLQLIMQARPDVLVKGGDWAVADIIGADEVKQWGGEVRAIEFEYQRSTTGLIERIVGSVKD